MGKKVVITGATGMVGKGVLLECIESESISEIILVSRKTVGINNPKIKEVLIQDFKEISEHKDQLQNVDACFYCMGVSSVGMKEQEYSEITFDLTKIFADTLYSVSPKSIFIFVSGVGTDSSEKGRSMWARVKGKTENYILNKGFDDAYACRPGAIIPVKGVKSKTRWVNIMYIFSWLFFPLFRLSKSVVTSAAIGKAMIQLLEESDSEKVITPKLINRLAK